MSADFSALDLDQFQNRALSDLGFACVGDESSRERIDADHIGGLFYSGLVDHWDVVGVYEFIVVSYGSAGLQLFIASRETNSQPTAIDLHVNAQRNDDPAFLAELQRVLTAWYQDYDSIETDVLADPAEVYAA